MPTEPGGLVVRHAERHRCDIPARLVIDPIHAEKVVLSKSARTADGGVPATVMDCSLGGLGLRSTVFFPKGCRLVVVCSHTPPNGDRFEAEFLVRVQRVVMLDRAPNYLIGVLHLRDDADDVLGPPALVAKMIDYVRSAWSPAGDAKGPTRA